MQIGDSVRVRATGRRAMIITELGDGRYRVEFLPDPADDPIDRDTVQSEEGGGIYSADDIEPLT